MEPSIRHMLVCEAVRCRPSSPLKLDVLGMFNAVRAKTLPARLTFCVHVVMTEGRGVGHGQIRVIEEDTDLVIYPGTAHELVFGPNPLEIVAVTFDIPCCTFPKRGLYRVEFMYNGIRLAHQPVIVKDES